MRNEKIMEKAVNVNKAEKSGVMTTLGGGEVRERARLAEVEYSR